MKGVRRSERFGLRACWLLGLVSACTAPRPLNARDIADANDTGGAQQATSDAERQLLAQLGTLESNAPHRIGNTVVLAGAPYSAASGRECRALHITENGSGSSQERLACRDERSWVFVPDVFAQSAR